MPRVRADCDLRATLEHESLTVQLSTSAVVFERAVTRRTVGLRFGRLGVGPDVSVQPGAVTAVIDDQARVAAADPNRWRLDTLRSLLEWEPDLDWCEPVASRLTTAIGAFTHPLLAEVYRHGSAALDEIPRWASPVLRAISASDAARVLAGGATTRRLTRVVGASLRGADDEVDLSPLALAVASAGLVSLDELANVLEAAASSATSSSVASVEQLRAIRAGLDCYPPQRRAALLVDAARRHSPARLAEVLTELRWVVHQAPRPLPQRVDELARMCGRLVPVLAAPQVRTPTEVVPATVAEDVPGRTRTQPAVRAPVRTEPARQPERFARRRQAEHRALAAPAAPARSPQRWPIPRQLLTISEHRSNGLTFCVPTSAAELGLWSRQLHNCLDTYASATAHERAWLIGIRSDDRLIGCVEVCPRTRRLRQAHGPRNRPLSDDVYDSTIRALKQAGILTIAQSG